MKQIKRLFYALAGVPVIAVLAWAVAVPTDLIEERIKGAVVQSHSGMLSLAVSGLKKGLLFSLHADGLDGGSESA